MAITLAVGTVVGIASAYGSAKTMSAITNAANAVATLEASHGVVVGDFVEVSSGWELLDARILRVSAVSTNDVTLEGLNSTSTTDYPVGTGVGSVRKVSTWTAITQLTREISVGGGDQQYADISTLSNRLDKKTPTTRTPIDVSLPFYDDPSLAWYSVVSSASDRATATAVRFIYPNGSRLVANAIWSLLKVPTITDSTLRGKIDMSFVSDPTRYAT